MKLISSLIRLDKVEAVKEALSKVNVVAFASAEARDHSPQTQTTIAWMGHAQHRLSLKMEIRLVVHDDDVDEVIGAIMQSARTGKAGDGYVCVTRSSIATTSAPASGRPPSQVIRSAMDGAPRCHSHRMWTPQP
jgi:nitrogen regulatory protein PII